jgi:hypothetical protein
MGSSTRLALRSGRGSRFVIQDSPLTIGRDPRNDVVIGSDSVSRRHATVRPHQNWVELRDGGSANGTFLNGHRLEQPVRIRPGDELRIGDERFTVETCADAPPAPPAVPVVHPPVLPVGKGFDQVWAAPRKNSLVPIAAIGALVLIAALAVTIFITRPLQPEEAARVWLDALAAQDVSQLSELTCLAQQNSIQATSLVVAAGGLFGTSLDVSGLQYQTTRSDPNSADVLVTGPIKLSLGPVATARRLNLTVRMRQEGGKWRYCDDVQRIANQFR